MGEAKRRGTFEERKSAAIERDKAAYEEHQTKRAALAEIERRKPSPKLSNKTKSLLIMAASMGPALSLKGKRR